MNKSNKSKYPRSQHNPYRNNSGYGLCYDILAFHKDGILKDLLVKLYAKACRKNIKLAGYDTAVVISSNQDGSANRSCRANGYWVERMDGGKLILHLR